MSMQLRIWYIRRALTCIPYTKYNLENYCYILIIYSTYGTFTIYRVYFNKYEVRTYE